MADSRAADYIHAGMQQGVQNFLTGLEKRREEEKRNAKEFKSLVSFAEASGMLSKDQAEVMDKDSLRGFVQAKMYNEEVKQQNQRASLAQVEAMQKFAKQQNMAGFQNTFNNSMLMSGRGPMNDEAFAGTQPQGDAMSAFHTALQQYPGVDPQDLSAFIGATEKMMPPEAKTYAPTDDFRMLQEISKLRAAGRDQEADKLDAILQKRAAPSGMSVRMNPDGSWELTQGATGSTTVGFRTEAQKAEVNAEATFATIDHIMKNQKASDWGVRGLVGKVQDEWLAQVVPGAADPRRVDVQATVSQLRQQMMSVLKAESQISQKDKEEIMASLPKLGPGESAPAAMQKIARAKELMADKVRAYTKKLGVPPPIYLMTLEEIAESKDKGLLSEMDAIQAILKYHPDKLQK